MSARRREGRQNGALTLDGEGESRGGKDSRYSGAGATATDLGAITATVAAGDLDGLGRVVRRSCHHVAGVLALRLHHCRMVVMHGHRVGLHGLCNRSRH